MFIERGIKREQDRARVEFLENRSVAALRLPGRGFGIKGDLDFRAYAREKAWRIENRAPVLPFSWVKR